MTQSPVSDKSSGACVILVAEDDPDDRLLLEEAFADALLPVRLRFVDDGEDLLETLHRALRPSSEIPMPSLILLDLNMPRMDGHEVLRAVKTDHRLRHIPVVVLTTSASEDDIATSYELGGSSFITKPVSFEALVELADNLGLYWLRTVRLPRA